jgi:C-terminal processing protease CtpA/Prc
MGIRVLAATVLFVLAAGCGPAAASSGGGQETEEPRPRLYITPDDFEVDVPDAEFDFDPDAFVFEQGDVDAALAGLPEIVGGAMVLPEIAAAFGEAGEGSSRAYLGVTLSTVSDARAKELGAESGGALVTQCVAGSPAASAGLKDGDVIVGVDGTAVASEQDLIRAVRAAKPGQVVELDVVRDKKHQTFKVTLGERAERMRLYRKLDSDRLREKAEKLREQAEKLREKAEKLREEADKMQENWRGQADKMKDEAKRFRMLKIHPGAFWYILGGTRLGLTVSSMTDQLRDYFGVEKGKGVLVTRVADNSPAAKAGLRAGDVILSVDGKEVGTRGSITAALAGLGDRASAQVVFVRGRVQQTTTVVFEK